MFGCVGGWGKIERQNLWAMLRAAEIKKHASAASCWVVIHGQAFDVTDFLPDHPVSRPVSVSVCPPLTLRSFKGRPSDYSQVCRPGRDVSRLFIIDLRPGTECLVQ